MSQIAQMTPPFKTVPEEFYALVLSIESEVDKEQLRMIRDMLAYVEQNEAAGEPTIITTNEEIKS